MKRSKKTYQKRFKFTFQMPGLQQAHEVFMTSISKYKAKIAFHKEFPTALNVTCTFEDYPQMK